MAAEYPLVGVGDWLIPDALVDRVRSRIRQVGEEEAELPAAVEQHPGLFRNERARVATRAVGCPAEGGGGVPRGGGRGGGVGGPVAVSVRPPPAVSGERHRSVAVDP